MAAPVASSPVRGGDGLSLLGLGSSLNEGHATAGQQAFLNGGLGVTHGIFDAVLALLASTSVAAPTLMTATPPASGQTLLQLLTVVIGVGVLNLGANLSHASVDVFLGASAPNNGGLVAWRR